jgi:tetratricopeptide (TPR) repeat protein
MNANNAAFIWMKANLEKKKGNYEEAIALFRRAAELSPYNENMCLSLCKTYEAYDQDSKTII